MIVRRLSPGEGAIFARIRLEALRQDPSSFAASASDYDEFGARDWDGVLARRTAFVAFDGEVPIGLASLVPMDLSRLAHRGEVTNVYVTPPHRGTGVARQLWQALQSHAVSEGIVQLELAVNVEKAGAIRFYEKLGFARTGLVPRGFRHGDRYYDEVLMIKQLDSEANPA